MEALTIREILEAVNGRLLGDFDDLDKTVSVVETDSRSISEGALFLFNSVSAPVRRPF